MNLRNEERADLLRALSLDAGQAELSDPRVIFPVPEHLRALEPEVVLIVGDRGAGKTQLMRALVDDGVREALIRHSKFRMPQGRVEWLTGWPLERGPDSPAWRRFAGTPGRSRDDFLFAWYGYLTRAVERELPDDARARLASVLGCSALEVDRIVDGARQAPLTALMDELDDRLAAEGRWLFVAYDELDTVVLEDWQTLGAIVRGLVSFWAAYARRWRRIRPKVFLRSDFYKHHREIAGADVAKLAANRVELQWSVRNLYGALMKHVLNKPGGKSLHEFFARLKNLALDEDPVLGFVPRLAHDDDAKPFVHRLVSEYMGPNESKGVTYRWLIDHLRDGNQRALPRALVWLLEFAAEIERDRPRAQGAHLLHHISVRNALDKVSAQYVQHATTHEFPWLDGLGRRLQANRKVPWKKRGDLLRLLGADFEGPWGPRENHDARPPGSGPEEVLEALIELGVVRARGDKSFDVPDLYLAGLRLTRQGGVAKR